MRIMFIFSLKQCLYIQKGYHHKGDEPEYSICITRKRLFDGCAGVGQNNGNT